MHTPDLPFRAAVASEPTLVYQRRYRSSMDADAGRVIRSTVDARGGTGRSESADISEGGG